MWMFSNVFNFEWKKVQQNSFMHLMSLWQMWFCKASLISVCGKFNETDCRATGRFWLFGFFKVNKRDWFFEWGLNNDRSTFFSFHSWVVIEICMGSFDLNAQ